MVRRLATVLAGLCLWAALAGGIEPSRALAAGCLSPGDLRAAVQKGEAVPLSQIKGQIEAAAGGKVQGIPRLCDAGGQLVYMVNVLTDGNKIKRLTVDARSGSIVGSGY